MAAECVHLDSGALSENLMKSLKLAKQLEAEAKKAKKKSLEAKEKGQES